MPNLLTSIGLATSQIPQAISVGRARGEEQFNTEQLQKQNREEAQKRKELLDIELQRQGRANIQEEALIGDKTAALEAQLKATAAESRAISNKLFKAESFQALNNFFDSGDPRSINTFFRDNPRATQVFDGMLRAEKLNLSSEEDRRLLKKSGLSDDDLDALDGKKDGHIDWDKLSRRYLKGVKTDGQATIVDVVAKAASMGYADYADEKRLAKMKQLADISKAQGGSGTAVQQNAAALGAARQRIAAGEGTPEDFALVDLTKKRPVYDPNETKTSLVKDAEAIAAAKDRMAAGTATTTDEILLALNQTKVAGVAAGKETLVDTARAEWTAKGFDNMSQEELQANPEARRLVNQIELAHDISEVQQKELLSLNTLVTLSDEAGQLSSTQAGLWDKATNDISSYISENVGDKRAKASYGAFINEFRHNLFGSALTEGELKAFKDAYGSLQQKIGPVLSGLRAAMIQVKSKLKTISDLNDPAVIKFRTGKSISQINSSLEGLDKRIKFYDLVSTGTDPDTAYEKVFGAKKVPSTKEEVSAALFGGN